MFQCSRLSKNFRRRRSNRIHRKLCQNRFAVRSTHSDAALLPTSSFIAAISVLKCTNSFNTVESTWKCDGTLEYTSIRQSKLRDRHNSFLVLTLISCGASSMSIIKEWRNLQEFPAALNKVRMLAVTEIGSISTLMGICDPEVREHKGVSNDQWVHGGFISALVGDKATFYGSDPCSKLG